ncbi:unnamed protein product [Prorocentrum cordatum]|uniref:EF-hand domain-containing protein n=1 Tax=Prorocentrum cordatum TaxID=2364126 RepID=A0ABN9XVB4_9DINO|nr:unnamed protein product [Polarella glacialis]
MALPAHAPAERLSRIELFVCGATAGAGAKTVAAPLDRIRLLYQLDPKVSFSVRGAVTLAHGVAREAGIEGLWRGHTATLWKIMPFAGVQFMVYDEAHSSLRVWLAATLQPEMARGPSDFLVPSAVLAGAAAAALATLVTYPQDVMRTRLVSHMGPLPAHRNYLTAVEHVLRCDGPSAFYRGLQPTLIGVLPYGAISWGTFEALKQQLRACHGVADDDDVPLVERLAAGSVSAALAQVVVYPLQVVRRRMQTDGPFAGSSLRRQLFDQLDIGAQGSGARQVEPLARRLGVPADELWSHLDENRSGRVSFDEFRRHGTLEALRSIRLTEGSAGFLKGASLSWAKGFLTVGLALGLNDKIKAMVCRRHLFEEGDQYAPLPGRADNAAEAKSGAQEHQKLHAIESLVCGGAAGAAAKTVIAPGDRLKILFQTDPTRKYTMRNVLSLGRSIVAEQGVRGLWRGHGATLLRVVPYSATSFATFEPYKAWLRRSTPSSSDVTVRFLAGAMAGTTATTLTYPLDMFRARMAARMGPQAQYDGYWRAAQAVVRAHGASALYSGLRPTLLGIVPYSGLSYCIFETLKARLGQRRPGGGLHVAERMGAGALAGLLAQSATYPLDIVRRRMQVDPETYRSEVQTAMSIWRAEGARGFFKGVSMNWLKGPVAMSISYFANDLLREHVARHGRR